MSKQTYKNVLVPSTFTSIRELMSGDSPPLGEVTVEIQNTTSNGLVYFSFGTPVNTTGSPLPPFWVREETEDLSNIYIRSSKGNVFVGIVIVGVV